MKIKKRIFYIFLVFVLLVQAPFMAFATDNESFSSDNDSNEYGMSDEGLIESTKAEIEELLQEQRKNESRTSLALRENAKKMITEERAPSIAAIEQEMQELLDEPSVKSSSSSKSASNLSSLFSGGDGTASTPYLITLPEQMANISQDLYAHYSLSNDIDMNGISWTPIGTFRGTFDGNNHVISNLEIDAPSSGGGIFEMCSGATIQNATLNNAIIAADSYTGGFVGLAGSSILSNLTIDNSSVSGNGLVGGIVGAITSATEIYNCSNNSTVNATSPYAGGIVGFMNGATIDDCVSTGEVNGSDYVGGIAGVLQYDANRCSNSGNVNGNMSVGGITGFLACLGHQAYVFNCFNSGNVSGGTEVAGISGYVSSNGIGIANIYHCANEGRISASGNYGGGIAGDSAGDVYISGCYNTGIISALSTAGGLVGRLNPNYYYYDGVLIRSYNAGKVASSHRAGSLIGYNAGYLVNLLYRLDFYSTIIGLDPEGNIAFGANASYNSPTPTVVTKATLRTLASTLAYSFIDDEEWINYGYPIKSNINYIFDESYVFDYPVVIVPGLMGSTLYEDLGGVIMWPVPDSLAVLDLALDNTGNSEIDISAPDGGFGTLAMYFPLAVSLSYKFGSEDVYFFSYDWRLDINDSVGKLQDFIEDIDSPKVNIVTHSMGGLVSARYMTENNNVEKVNKYISIATPYLGSTKAPYAFATGDISDFFNIIGLDDEFRRISSHMTSVYQLLPHLNENPYLYEGTVKGAADFSDYTAYGGEANEADYIRYGMKLIDVNYNVVSSTVKGYFLDIASAFMGDLYPNDNPANSPVFASESVDTYMIVGNNGADTIGKLAYNPSIDEFIDIDYCYGDGTVPLWSARVNDNLNDVLVLEHDSGHIGILANVDVHNQIMDIFNNITPTAIPNQAGSSEYVVVRIAADAEVTITNGEETLTNVEDSMNTKTAFGSMNLIGENEDIIMMSLKAGVDYDIVINSFESATMDYTIRFFDSDNNLIEERSFEEISTANITNIITNTSRSENTVLSVDTTGSGVIDATLQPNRISR